MSNELCLCGHLRLYHCNDREGRIGRGRCTGSVRQFFVPLSDKARLRKKPYDRELTKEQREEFVRKTNEYCESLLAKRATSKYHRVKKMLLQGFHRADCACEMFHLVELGQVKLFKPGSPR